MPGDVILPPPPFPPQSPTRHHKRPHEDETRNGSSNRHNSPLHWFDHPTPSGTDFRGIHLVGQQRLVQQRRPHDPEDDSTGSVASSHKRARLYGEYRENSSVMDSSDEDGETTLCSNVAVRSASEDASTGRWLLRSSPSNFSITSTLTEISDTMETVSQF